MDFSGEGLHGWLDGADASAIDALDFGVVGIDRNGMTCLFSQYEVTMTGLPRDSVLGRPFFKEIARCMDNGLVARRFDEAILKGETLDAAIDYVFALRSAITPVRLRLLAQPGSGTRYLAIQRIASGDA